ncbi:hypothetical protein [Devosia sp.]|uniref:hypothetical protein n=1 Tax=Devosia sp. TaxID=1871048 RepID=UPI002FCA1B55
MTLSRPVAAVFRALLVAGLMVPLGATAEENLGWHGDATEGGATLFYGIPQSGYGQLSFSCQAGSDTVTFAFFFEPVMANDGVEVVVLLQAGDIEVPIRTTGARMLMDDQFVLEGQAVLDARLADLLTSRGTLLVFVEDGAEEYPLDGAREAAAALIETCGPGAATAAIDICEVDAWVQGDKPKALVIRDGPASENGVIGHLPEPYQAYGETFFTAVRITGARDGWFRIDQAVTRLYGDDIEPEVAFEGEGWVPGHVLRLDVESPVLYAHPARDAPVAMNFDNGGGVDSFIVDGLHACRGRWVEVEGVYAGNAARGWSDDTCASQITTCP